MVDQDLELMRGGTHQVANVYNFPYVVTRTLKCMAHENEAVGISTERFRGTAIRPALENRLVSAPKM
jgi:hypothetical protein